MVGSTLHKIETAISNNYHSYNPLCEQLRLQEQEIAKQVKEFTEL
jgi:putative heme degradation protein